MNDKKKEPRKKPRRAQTMGDIARLSGVSKPTVSRVMNGSTLVAEKTRLKVLDVVRKNAYSVNQAARRLRQRRTNTIAVVVALPSLPSHRYEQPFMFDLLAGVIKALNDQRLDGLLVCPEIEIAETYEQMIASRVVDGVIFLGQGERPDVLRDLASTKMPFVTWGAPDETTPYCTVGSDNPRGGEMIGARFAELGRRHILFVGWLDGAEIEMQRRREGLEQGLYSGAGANFELHDLQPAGPSCDACRTSFQAYLDSCGSMPDAIFCAGDSIAMTVLSVLRARNVAVPEQTSVIGYDDIPAASLQIPTVTTIRQDTRLAGALLVDKLIQRINGNVPRSSMLPTQLVVRDS